MGSGPGPPPLENPVSLSEPQRLRVQITLSEHPLETVIFLSFLPAMGFRVSEINYKLVRRLSPQNLCGLGQSTMPLP